MASRPTSDSCYEIGDRGLVQLHPEQLVEANLPEQLLLPAQPVDINSSVGGTDVEAMGETEHVVADRWLERTVWETDR